MKGSSRIRYLAKLLMRKMKIAPVRVKRNKKRISWMEKALISMSRRMVRILVLVNASSSVLSEPFFDATESSSSTKPPQIST